jgi:hypothetical protein
VGDVDTSVVRYNQVDGEALHQGQRALDPMLAVQRCEQAEIVGSNLRPYQVKGPLCTPSWTATAVSETVNLPTPFFMPSATVRATRIGQLCSVISTSWGWQQLGGNIAEMSASQPQAVGQSSRPQ